MKSSNKWWDGYCNQDIVLIDDLEKKALTHLAHFLKLWGDPYGELYGEIKGSQVPLNFKELYITSNYSIASCCQECFPDDEMMLEALTSRFE